MISPAERWKNLIYRVWAPNDGRPEHIFSITDSHLENIRNWLVNFKEDLYWHAKRHPGKDDYEKFYWCRAWLTLIDTEQKRRAPVG